MKREKLLRNSPTFHNMISLACLLILFVGRPFVKSGDFDTIQVALPMRGKPLVPAPTTNTTNTTSTETTPDTSITTKTTKTVASNNTARICDVEAPTPEVWKARNISGYLASYPSGHNVTISVIQAMKSLTFTNTTDMGVLLHSPPVIFVFF
ncbi:hypothetical protein PTTG_07569 [Puccinia triticina 1-1 BBBD Race 1]|uniref:Plastocyanin-like domain-containing protein n=1 Tax=Puccinia triticina (isolate 1-1 / race 1 (BBBD)) TaxID=630390 RepID=A0A180GPF1_PUCT1|nr:hypothetical protein PTTG_07569 [Puccinia triticina 1-1 BBBD Race 1]